MHLHIFIAVHVFHIEIEHFICLFVVMFILDHFPINIKWNNFLHVHKNIEVYIYLPIELMKAMIQTYIQYI